MRFMMLRTTASSAARSTPAMPRQIAEGSTRVSASVFSITLWSTFSSASSPTPCRFAPSSRADALDEGGAVAKIAATLPEYGVTAFCPTTVACAPAALHDVLASIQDIRQGPAARGARVLGAHLESNFINPEYKGAQPEKYLYS